MTDKELFEKTRKYFNINKKSIVVEVFEKGNFNKVLTEIRGPKEPTPPPVPKAGGFFNRLAAAIPGTRGHRMRSAEARKQEAEAKSAEVKARQGESDLFGGKSNSKLALEPPKQNETPEEKKKRDDRNARRRATYAQNKIDKKEKEIRDHEFKMTALQKAGNQTTTLHADKGSTIATGDVTSTQKQDLSQNTTARAKQQSVARKRPVKKPVNTPKPVKKPVI
tara:strand:+ start:423 stop:1088 length:666 start_codon:yes stop_codon:yes gene_type:complete